MIETNTINSETMPLSAEMLEALNAKFKIFAKEYFQFEAKSSIEYLTRIKESTKLFHLNIPPNLSEVFIRIEEAPLFWIYDSPLVQYLEDTLRIYLGKSNDYDNYKSIKDCYTKWIVIKSENEKRYFANSVLSYIDRSTSKYNFFYLILKAVLFTFEKSIADADKANELYNRSIDVVNSTKVSETYKDELLYLIHVFSAFAFLKQKNNEQAKAKFSDALRIKPLCVTAKFYLALIEVQQSEFETAVFRVNELYEYDLKRIEYAVHKNNVGMFKYFVNNSAVYNLFSQREFAVVIDGVEQIFTGTSSSSSTDISQLKLNLSKLNDLEMKKYFTEETTRTIGFMEKFVDHFLDSKNLLVTNSLRFLTRRFNEAGLAIYESIKQKYFNEVKAKLRKFDDLIQEKQYAITLLTTDFEALKTKQKEKLVASIKIIEKKIEDYVLLIEAKIKAIPSESKHDPVDSFKNMMTYNVVISSLLFFIGGCSGYSTQQFNGGTEFKEMLGQLILAGIKWGLATFLIGFLLAVIIAVSTFVKREMYKQKLLQKINWLKNQKELEINGIKKEIENKDKLLKENYDERIEDLKDTIENLIKDRSKLEIETKKIIDEQLKKEAAPLLALIALEASQNPG